MPRPAAPPRYKPYLFLPDGWDAAWKAAKSAAGTTPAQIMFLGDSIQVGVLASDWKNSYVHLIRESLKTSLGGLHADYFGAAGYSANPSFNVPGTPPWSNDVGAGAVINLANAFGWHYDIHDTNATEPTTYYHQTFTSPDACTDLDLFYVDFISGTFKYSVDGGTDQTLTCTNASSNSIAPVVKVQAATGLASGIHTLAVGKQSVSAVAIPMGVAEYPTGRSGGGLAIARFCAGLTNLSDYFGTSTTQHPPNRPELFSGPMSGSATVSSPRTFGFPTQPHLAIIALGVNDCNAALSAANFESVLRRIIQSIRRGQQNASILFHIVCNPDPDSSDCTSGFQGANWNTYTNLFMDYAQRYNCAVLNTHAKWGETPVANGMLTVPNNVHPTIAGHADIATDLLGVL
jgi:GDSL-like Lipase/Acylhydrolase family